MGPDARRSPEPAESVGTATHQHRIEPPQSGDQTMERTDRGPEEVLCPLAIALAGFLDYTDEQVGRLTSFLANIDRLDNTIIVVISDNGASQEGGLEGTLN